MLGSQQRQAAGEIAAELDDIRAAWHWAAQHHLIEAIDGAIEALTMYWHIKGRYLDAARMLEDALHHLKEVTPAEQPVRALLLSEMGWIAIRLGHFDKAEQAFHECDAIYRQLELSPLPGQGTDPLLGLSTLASIQGDYAQAEHLAQQARQIAADQIHLNNLQTANYQLPHDIMNFYFVSTKS
jgi:tetratricopeptide (TPR) repeat protein